jgi:outer membrane protein assembly factor BamD (BamD/ComL family)
MQSDMLVIKTQWQKKCSETEKQLREFYEGELIKLEDKKNREAIQHLEAVKEGKSIVIKQDEELTSNRI